MPRNLNDRVEVLFPIEDSHMIRHVRDDILAIYFRDNSKNRLMLGDGSYRLLTPENNAEISVQETLMAKARQI